MKRLINKAITFLLSVCVWALLFIGLQSAIPENRYRGHDYVTEHVVSENGSYVSYAGQERTPAGRVR